MFYSKGLGADAYIKLPKPLESAETSNSSKSPHPSLGSPPFRIWKTKKKTTGHPACGIHGKLRLRCERASGSSVTERKHVRCWDLATERLKELPGRI